MYRMPILDGRLSLAITKSLVQSILKSCTTPQGVMQSISGYYHNVHLAEGIKTIYRMPILNERQSLAIAKSAVESILKSCTALRRVVRLISGCHHNIYRADGITTLYRMPILDG